MNETFEDFARAHGLIFRHIESGKWVAVPTTDHPRKRNGRYKFLGGIGWVQNWATMQSPEVWRDGTSSRLTLNKIIRESSADRAREGREAASKAAWILSQCHIDTHPYLAAKGFPKERGHVWVKDEPLLVIPMRSGGRLVGCQLIDKEGGKKFLRGQISKGASFEIGTGGTPVFCEGYATGLSLRDALSTSQLRYKIYVCFSAGNMEGISIGVVGGFVVADNDLSGTGESAARKAGKPYWISPTVREDFNDFHRRVGLFQASQAIKKMVYSARG